MPKLIDDNVVFRAAVDVFVACGYEKATTKNIADAAGIHEATLFRKYGSKFNLVEQAIAAQFREVSLAKLAYTGDLQADLLAVIIAYLETSAMVGDILPILLTEIPRNPELKAALGTAWQNIASISGILEQYQAQGILKAEPVLNSISVLLGPLMVRHLIERADQDFPLPAIEPQMYVDNFLHGRLV